MTPKEKQDVIAGPEQADRTGARVIEIESEISRIEADLATQVAGLKAQAGSRLEPLKAELKTKLESLGDFFWANIELRDKGRKGQLTLHTVRISERTDTVYKYPSPLTKVIDKARKLGLGRFVRTKEEVDKDSIRKSASDDDLRALGIKQEERKTVYVEQLELF